MKQYTIFEIADMFNINAETVRRWIRSGKLYAERGSKKEGWIVNENELTKFVSKYPKYGARFEVYDVSHIDTTYAVLRISMENTLSELKKERDVIDERISILEKILKEI